MVRLGHLLGAAEPVGDLIEKLKQFDPDLPVVTANALTGTASKFEWILTVGLLPLAFLAKSVDRAGLQLVPPAYKRGRDGCVPARGRRDSCVDATRREAEAV